MAKKLSGPQIVTANHLRGGDVVYFTGHGEWSVWIDDAAVAEHSADGDALLQNAIRTASAAGVVEPFLIEIQSDEDSGRVVPVRFRERLRANGPSIHPMFGKQAGQHASLDSGDVSHAYANGV